MLRVMDSISSWVLEAIGSLGYVGIALLMCLENLFPPIPSELIMPLAGVLAAEGDLSLTAAVAAGSAGSLLGQSAWYGLGRKVGERRLKQLATTAWTAALTMAGYLLRAQFTRIDDVLGPVSTTIIVVLVGWYLWRVATYGRRQPSVH